MGAYQKAVVMKYLDNLISWGDHLFRMDSIESINEATLFYIEAAGVLGRRPEIIKAIKLVPFFHCIILSNEVKVRKPDPRIYYEALHCLELDADDGIFVSDQLSDLEGASAVGFKTILIRQGEYTHHDVNDPTFTPDYNVPTIADLMTLL